MRWTGENKSEREENCRKAKTRKDEQVHSGSSVRVCVCVGCGCADEEDDDEGQ